MGEFYMGQELLQPELPANSPKPPETPPEGVIMTDVGQDGWSRRYLYRALAGTMPEEILISETPPVARRASVLPVIVEEIQESYEPEPMMGMSPPEVPAGIILPEGALLPEHAVFSGIPSEPRKPVLSGAGPASTPLILPQPSMNQRAPQTIPQPFQKAAVPAVGLQAAAAPVSLSVQPQTAPVLGASISVPRTPEPPRETSQVVRLSNSLDMLKPVPAPVVAETGRMAPREHSAAVLGQPKSIPLIQEGKKPETYQVQNPVAPVPAPAVGAVKAPTAFIQNQVPFRKLGQQAPAPAPAPAEPPVTTTKCPGAVEMPDGRVIEPGDTIMLKDLCELVPFLVETLAKQTDGRLNTVQRPGMPIPTQGPGFGPAGGGPYSHVGGGFISGGGGAPGPTGPAGPAGLAGPRGPGSIVEPPVVKTDGDFTAGPGAFAPVPGTSLTFSLSAAGIAEFMLTATLGSTAGVVGESQSGQLGLRIDGTDYPLSTRLLHTFAPGVAEFLIGQNSVFALSLGAGSHTVEVVIRGLVAGEFGGAGLGTPLTIAATPSVPVILTVSHS